MKGLKKVAAASYNIQLQNVTIQYMLISRESRRFLETLLLKFAIKVPEI